MNAIGKSAVLSLIVLAAGCGRETQTAITAAGVVDGTVVIVRAIAGGRLVEWSARPGHEVRKNEVLGRLDPSRIENGLEELALSEREIALAEDRDRARMPTLQAKVEYLKKQADRLERLKKDQAAAGDEIEKIRLELLGAETALADLRKSLSAQAIEKDKIANKRRAFDIARDDLFLRAPIDGLVTETHVTAGEILPPGAPAAELLDTSRLWVDVFVEEKELSRLRLADRVAVLIDGREGREWPGTIVQFGSTAEFSSKYTVSEKERSALLFKVRIGLDADPKTFKLGMPVTVVFRRAPVKG
jgi:multidrug resistance efflux pump